MALKYRAHIQDYMDLPHVFSTIAEALKIVAIPRFKNPEKLSCCAEQLAYQIRRATPPIVGIGVRTLAAVITR